MKPKKPVSTMSDAVFMLLLIQTGRAFYELSLTAGLVGQTVPTLLQLKGWAIAHDVTVRPATWIGAFCLFGCCYALLLAVQNLINRLAPRRNLMRGSMAQGDLHAD